MPDLEGLEAHGVTLDREIAELRESWEELERMRIVLSSGEKLTIEGRVKSEKVALDSLRQREVRAREEMRDFEEERLEELRQAVAALEERRRETDPLDVRARWNAAMEKEERRVSSRIRSLSQLLTLGRDLGQLFAE
jgi:hypothetical protein